MRNRLCGCGRRRTSACICSPSSSCASRGRRSARRSSSRRASCTTASSPATCCRQRRATDSSGTWRRAAPRRGRPLPLYPASCGAPAPRPPCVVLRCACVHGGAGRPLAAAATGTSLVHAGGGRPDVHACDPRSGRRQDPGLERPASARDRDQLLEPAPGERQDPRFAAGGARRRGVPQPREPHAGDYRVGCAQPVQARLWRAPRRRWWPASSRRLVPAAARGARPSSASRNPEPRRHPPGRRKGHTELPSNFVDLPPGITEVGGAEGRAASWQAIDVSEVCTTHPRRAKHS